jgi:hypothetical protein
VLAPRFTTPNLASKILNPWSFPGGNLAGIGLFDAIPAGFLYFEYQKRMAPNAYIGAFVQNSLTMKVLFGG